MLKIKKGLANILENNNEPEATSQPQTPQHVQLQTAQIPVAQPPAPQAAAWQMADQIGWEEHLIQALAKAPEDVAQKLASCIDREVLLRALLKRRDDPYLKVTLLILKEIM
jgi:hypothetical protein